MNYRQYIVLKNAIEVKAREVKSNRLKIFFGKLASFFEIKAMNCRIHK